MRRFVCLLVSVVVASTVLFVAPASGQEETTTTVEETTTTVETTTTLDPGPTTTTILDIELPGERINDGTLTIGAQLQNAPELTCQLVGSVAGQQMNLVRNETGNIGAVYGKADIGGGTAGMIMVQLGPLPTAIIAYRTTGGCDQDVVGIGGFAGNQTQVSFQGIGFAAYPGDFASFVTAQLTVTDSGGAPNLNLQEAQDYLNTPRVPLGP